MLDSPWPKLLLLITIDASSLLLGCSGEAAKVPMSEDSPILPTSPVPPASNHEIVFARDATSALALFLKTDNRPLKLKQDAVLSKGDTVQLGFKIQQAHAAILSLDGNRTVSIHFPERAPCSTAVATNTKIALLSHSFELDDAPLYEHFFLLSSDEPIDVVKMKDWFLETPYNRLLKDRLPDGVKIVDDFRVAKR